MKKITTTAALIFSFMVCLAVTLADLNGKWTGSLTTPDGNEIPVGTRQAGDRTFGGGLCCSAVGT